LSNSVFVIIGAGGMGTAIAHRLGSGRTIVLSDVSPQKLDAATRALTANGHDVRGVAVDVTSPRSVADLASYATALGPVTGVAHTAGVSPEQADIDTILHVDLVGVAMVLEQFGEAIQAGGAGVVIASMAGIFTLPWTPGSGMNWPVHQRGICWRCGLALRNSSATRKRHTGSPSGSITFGSPPRHPHGANAERESTRSVRESSQHPWASKNSTAGGGR
jgi:NAD(P)-dependent dehydrogenase (short-subunit alcohol dehydrogenase family)